MAASLMIKGELTFCGSSVHSDGGVGILAFDHNRLALVDFRLLFLFREGQL